MTALLDNPLGITGSGSTVASVSEVSTHAVNAGELVVLFGAASRPGYAFANLAVSDDAGNTYTTLVNRPGSTQQTDFAIAASLITTPLTTSSALRNVLPGTGYAAIAGVSFTNVKQLAAYASAINQNFGPSATVTSSASVKAGDLALLLIVAQAGSTLATPAGWNSLGTLGSPQCGCFYQTPTSTGTLTATVTVTNGQWSAAIVALPAVAANGLTMLV